MLKPIILIATLSLATLASAQQVTAIRAAHYLDVPTGKLISPAVILIQGDRILAINVPIPANAQVIDLGDQTLCPGLIDAHVHLFLHPGAEDLQTVQESIPQRTLIALDAARLDLMAGFTAERDMGTEGAGPADTAIRNAIDDGLFPGPRMRMSGNAIDILGGHEDAIGYNPAQHVISNADYANSAQQLVEVIREQRKQGADFTKIYETGPDKFIAGSDPGAGVFTTPYQFTVAELQAAIAEAARYGKGPGHSVAVHATGEPGTGYAAQAGVASIDHAYNLSPATMALMKAKGIPAVPTFTISEYFANQATGAAKTHQQAELAFHAAQFKLQLAAGVPMAVGSDVGPFPHGTQARELELMVQYGMPPADVLRADYLNGAKLLGWQGQIGELKPTYYADIIAVPGNPLTDIATFTHVTFVMKAGKVYKR